MPINDYEAWATGVGATVMPQAAYTTNPALRLGVSAGIADEFLANKTWRQSSVAAAAIAQFIVDSAAVDMLDDGDITSYVANLKTALKAYLYSGVTPVARIRLTGNTTFYVGGTGANDANPGTSLAPFATLSHAAQVVNSQYDTAGFSVTYQCSGAFTQGIGLHAAQVGAVSAQSVTFNFLPGSTVTVVNGPCVYCEFGAAVQISGPVVLSSPGTSGIAAGVACFAGSGGSILVGDQVSFGVCDTSHIYGGVILVGPTYSIVGSAPSHLLNLGDGSATIYSPQTFGGHVTVTLTGTPSFSSGFARASYGGKISIPSSVAVFSGGGTGPRYFANNGASISTNGGGASFLPGNSAGTADGGTFALYT